MGGQSQRTLGISTTLFLLIILVKSPLGKAQVHLGKSSHGKDTSSSHWSKDISSHSSESHCSHWPKNAHCRRFVWGLPRLGTAITEGGSKYIKIEIGKKDCSNNCTTQPKIGQESRANRANKANTNKANILSFIFELQSLLSSTASVEVSNKMHKYIYIYIYIYMF